MWLLSQTEGLGIEPPMGLDVPHRQADADLGDPLVTRRDQPHQVALRVGQGCRRVEARPRQDQFAIAAGRRIRQRLGHVVDLQHRAQGVVPVLVLASADRQQMVEGHARLPLPEGQHGGDVVGGEADIDPRLGQLHDAASSISFLGLARDPGP